MNIIKCITRDSIHIIGLLRIAVVFFAIALLQNLKRLKHARSSAKKKNCNIRCMSEEEEEEGINATGHEKLTAEWGVFLASKKHPLNNKFDKNMH